MSVAVVLLPAASVVVTLAIDGGVGVGGQVGAGDVDAEKPPAATSAGVGDAVDDQGDGVAVLDVAADRAGDGNRAAGLGRIDDVVGGDGVDVIEAGDRGVDAVGLGVGGRGAVAGRVGGGDAGIDGGVGIGGQVGAGDVDARSRRRDRAGVGDAVDDQGDGVADPGRRRRPCR